MAINLKTDCEKCIHKNVCRHRNNAKHMRDKLMSLTYGNGPNDDYDWNTMSDVEHVEIDFSCPAFETAEPIIRMPSFAKDGKLHS